ncbi:MAG: hypothetical protein WCQ57_11760, partial [Verrucomicrobiota bacterium]
PDCAGAGALLPQASQQGQQGSAEALKAAAQSAAQASAASLQSAQAAAGENLPGAQQANAQTAQNLASASQQLAMRQDALRNQAGLPTLGSSSPSQDGSNGADQTDNSDSTSGVNFGQGSSESTGPAGAPQQGFPPAMRQAMTELRKTPVPSEFSGSVQAYFESLAAE